MPRRGLACGSLRRCRVSLVEFIPQASVIGAFVVPPDLQQGGRVPRAKLEKLWSEIGQTYKYTSFQFTPDEGGVQIQGSKPGDLVNVQPPLIQIQTSLDDGSTTEAAARKAQEILGAVLRVFNVPQINNLGIRHVFTAPLPTNDARDFLLHKVLSFGGENLEHLEMGAGDIWGGVKYVVPHSEGGHYTIQIEPLQADQMRSLFIDIDAQFVGAAAPTVVESRAADVSRYVAEHLGPYLDGLISG